MTGLERPLQGLQGRRFEPGHAQAADRRSCSALEVGPGAPEAGEGSVLTMRRIGSPAGPGCRGATPLRGTNYTTTGMSAGVAGDCRTEGLSLRAWPAIQAGGRSRAVAGCRVKPG